MANAYFYSSTAVQTSLLGSISAGATTATVNDTTGWPVSFPFVAAIDYGSAPEELVKVTANSANTLTIVRAFNGTSAQSHSLGAVVRHVYCANDATDFRTHEAATSGVHGVAGALVGTTDIQTLTNKTLTAPTINAGALSGTFTGAPTFSGAVILSGTPNISAGAALAGTFTGSPTFTGAPTFSGAVVLSGTPNISNGATLNGTVAGTPTFSGQVGFSVSPLATLAAAGTLGYRTKVTADANDRWKVTADGTMGWGIGSAVTDTDLYRLGVNSLATDGAFTAFGNFSAANVNTAAWTAYTPAWTSTGTAPVLNNGTLTGRYVQIGKFVHGVVTLTIGTTTTVGTGVYSISLPNTSAGGLETYTSCRGTFGGVSRGGWVSIGSAATTLQALFPTTGAGDNSTATGWSQTAPAAPVSGDSYRFTFTYEAA